MRITRGSRRRAVERAAVIQSNVEGSVERPPAKRLHCARRLLVTIQEVPDISRPRFYSAFGSAVDADAAFGSALGAASSLQPDKANPRVRIRANKIQPALRRDAFMARSLTFFAKSQKGCLNTHIGKSTHGSLREAIVICASVPKQSSRSIDPRRRVTSFAGDEHRISSRSSQEKNPWCLQMPGGGQRNRRSFNAAGYLCPSCSVQSAFLLTSAHCPTNTMYCTRLARRPSIGDTTYFAARQLTAIQVVLKHLTQNNERICVGIQNLSRQTGN